MRYPMLSGSLRCISVALRVFQIRSIWSLYLHVKAAVNLSQWRQYLVTHAAQVLIRVQGVYGEPVKRLMQLLLPSAPARGDGPARGEPNSRRAATVMINLAATPGNSRSHGAFWTRLLNTSRKRAARPSGTLSSSNRALSWGAFLV